MNNERFNEVVSKDERLDDLLIGDYKVLQSKLLYNFTSDSVRLANFSKVKNSDNVLELCAGCGIISLHKFADNQSMGDRGEGKWILIELQKPLFSLIQKNIYINELEKTFTAINDDLKNTLNYVEKSSIDVVICNPPYEKSDTGFKKKNESEQIARAEVATKFESIAQVVGKVLRFGGAFYFICKSERLFEISDTLSKNNMTIKQVKFIGKNKRFRLALVKAVLGAKSGADFSIFVDDEEKK